MMGIGASKDFEEMEEDCSGTPVSNRKILSEDFDPRSPSIGFTRTPIQVENTPQGAQAVIDPRSPTTGITRTPIYHERNGKTGILPSTPLGLPVVQGGQYSEDQNESYVENVNSKQEEQDAEKDQPTLDLPDQPTPDLREKTKDEAAATTVEPARKVASEAKVRVNLKKKLQLTANTSGSPTIFRDPAPTQPLRSSDGSTSSSYASGNLSPRSPLRSLSNSDSVQSSPFSLKFDSPRIIVQRKQTNRITKFRNQLGSTFAANGHNSPGKYELMENEKENH